MPDLIVTRLAPRTSKMTWETSEASSEGGRYAQRANTETSWTVEGIALNASGELSAEFPVAEGDVVHVVYGIYSTGDSFGHDERASIEFFTVHADAALAERNAEILRKFTRESEPQFLTTDGGTRLPVQVPWLCWFEKLNEVSVKALTVLPA